AGAPLRIRPLVLSALWGVSDCGGPGTGAAGNQGQGSRLKAAHGAAGSGPISFGRANVARLAAFRAIVEPVHAEADVLLRLAEAAVFLAGALLLRLIALRTEGYHAHRLSAAPRLSEAAGGAFIVRAAAKIGQARFCQVFRISTRPGRSRLRQGLVRRKLGNLSFRQRAIFNEQNSRIGAVTGDHLSAHAARWDHLDFGICGSGRGVPDGDDGCDARVAFADRPAKSDRLRANRDSPNGRLQMNTGKDAPRLHSERRARHMPIPLISLADDGLRGGDKFEIFLRDRFAFAHLRIAVPMASVRIGEPGHIVTPLWVEVVIQDDGRKQAEFEGRAWMKSFDDLPGSLKFLVG